MNRNSIRATLRINYIGNIIFLVSTFIALTALSCFIYAKGVGIHLGWIKAICSVLFSIGYLLKRIAMDEIDLYIKAL